MHGGLNKEQYNADTINIASTRGKKFKILRKNYNTDKDILLAPPRGATATEFISAVREGSKLRGEIRLTSALSQTAIWQDQSCVGWVWWCRVCEALGGKGMAASKLTASSKSQLAIEHCYRLRDRSPDTWVFWVHASSSVRIEESVREIAEAFKLPGREKSADQHFPTCSFVAVKQREQVACGHRQRR